MAAGVVRVAIVASGACHSCRSRELCGMGESSEKIIEVFTPDAPDYRIGESVVVAEEQRMALRALLLAYVGAFGVLILLLVGALLMGLGEGWAALLSLMGVGLYYLGIYLCRHRIERTIYFTIKRD